MKRFLLGIFLGGCAWTDGKRREISIGWLCFWAVFGIFFFWKEEEQPLAWG